MPARAPLETVTALRELALEKSSPTGTHGEASGNYEGAVLADRYVIDRLIGEGGMAHVFLAYDLERRERVALKIMRRELLNDDEAVRRFAKEAVAVARVNHPSVVKVISLGVLNDGQRFVVMELLRGQPLEHWVRTKLPIDWVVRVGVQVADALAAAHEAGVIHRDIKPENIVLVRDPDGGIRGKLIDFGLAKIPADARMTLPGTVFGTPSYMSPEQVEGCDADGQTDVYSFGVVLYELITGRVPFAYRDMALTMYAHVADELPPVAPLRPECPERLARLIERCLAKAPSDRLTAPRVRDELQAIERGATDTLVLPPQLNFAEQSDVYPVVNTAPPVEPNTRTHRRWAGVGVAAAVALVPAMVALALALTW